MAIDTVLTALSERLPDYELIRDCISGQRAVKKKRTHYLPDPDETYPDKEERDLRYKTYLLRAVFYGVTGRTLRGLVGLVMDRDPSLVLPDLLEIVKVDASGSGTTLDQQASATLEDVVGLGRAGLLVDYPRTQGPTTRADQEAGNIRPTILRYQPEQVINWRTRTVGSKVLLSLVVIVEPYVIDDDGYAETIGKQYRVLRLSKANTYTVEIHRDTESNGQYAMSEAFTPTDGAGKPFTEIPFTFVGAKDNDPSVDLPPMLDLAELNIAHYRNSADYEESVFVNGQATPVVSGLSTRWINEVLGGKIRYGSRSSIALPEGGQAQLLQAEANTMAFEALTHKEKQMIAIGAKLIENTGTQQTATEASIDSVMDNSVLGTCARNVSKAYVRCLQWAYQYVTGELVVDDEIIDYELSTDFEARNLTAADRTEIVNEWQKGAITYTEMRWNMKRSGIAYLDDEEAKAESDAEKETSIEFEAKAASALAEAGGAANTPPQANNQ